MEKEKDTKSMPQPIVSSLNANTSPSGKMSFEIDLPKDDCIICRVCGHSNPKQTGICVMCSNYLFKPASIKKTKKGGSNE